MSDLVCLYLALPHFWFLSPFRARLSINQEAELDLQVCKESRLWYFMTLNPACQLSEVPFSLLSGLAGVFHAWLWLGSCCPGILWQRLQHKEVMRDLNCYRSDLGGFQDITTSETQGIIYYKTPFPSNFRKLACPRVSASDEALGMAVSRSVGADCMT